MRKIWFFSLFSLASFACAEKPNPKEMSMTFMAKHISVSINAPRLRFMSLRQILRTCPNGPRDSVVRFEKSMRSG
jgi:hypothetical protein